LIPDSSENAERSAIRRLFSARLPAIDAAAARAEWLEIVEARHQLWHNVSSPKAELIRGFFNVVNLEIVKRIRPSSVFDFRNASVGNLFITGYFATDYLGAVPSLTHASARLFTGSLESAIYLLSTVCEVPSSVAVLPAINTNFSHHICAILDEGTVIPGQNMISHPLAQPSDTTISSNSAALPDAGRDTLTRPSFLSTQDVYGTTRREVEYADAVEDANLPGSLPTLRKQYIDFNKAQNGEDDLPGRISRIYYINPYGQEIRPAANSKILTALSEAKAIIYSVGSLYTSIIPSLVLRGVGDAIAAAGASTKVLILNGARDRESGPSRNPLEGLDFIQAIAKACKGSQSATGEAQSSPLRTFVTHLIYLEGHGVPLVDRQALLGLGIEPVKVYGRKSDGGGCRYDDQALTQALAFCIRGGKQSITEKSRSRRNTLES